MGNRPKAKFGPLDVWKACVLGRHGFAHRYIASRQFGLVPEKLEKWQIGVISSILQRNEIRVTDYRMGRTPIAKSTATRVTKIVKGADHEKLFAGLQVYTPPKPRKPRVKKGKQTKPKTKAG